ncbi:radial spoke head protein 3 homolog B isoform X2 [Phymastichus coffea]|uniref:radial spoke head protein 3 homolog B isoform X2 n=1 Tax=Phymastichus coffea TaxID=108790 RepID=UPI00273A9CDA|nr:radial spoke head protein 3 homolog B isoform X2 [Phymastichus coffea]
MNSGPLSMRIVARYQFLVGGNDWPGKTDVSDLNLPPPYINDRIKIRIDRRGHRNADEDEERGSSDSRITAINVGLFAVETEPNVRELSRSGEKLEHNFLNRLWACSHEQNKSQSNLHDRGKQHATSTSQQLHLSTEKFNKLLSAKLRNVQRQLVAKTSCAHHPRPFISTVKSGEFLSPSPEMAHLMDLHLPEAITHASDSNADLYDPHAQARFRQQLVTQSRLHSQPRYALRPASALVNLCVSNHSRQMDQPSPFGNLMFDRRIARDSIFAVSTPLVNGDRYQTSRQAEARKRQLIQKRCQVQKTKTTLLFRKPDEIEIGSQTDYFLDRPATLPFCQSKKGIDATTQIEPGDLFDYDVEVQPILEVLVGKTIEQALIEVLEEEEMALLREQQKKFLDLRVSDKAEEERLEEQDRRLRDEKNRRVRQCGKALKTRQETEERIAAAVLLTGYIAELLPTVLEGLKISGFLLDEIKADVKEDFMQWLMKEVKNEIGTIVESQEILEDNYQSI